MKKTLSVHLGGRSFLIEEDGYALLDQYLSTLTQRFVHEGNVEEVIADIEFSIGEKFSERLNTQREVITHEDVEFVISILGQVEDIASSDEATIIKEEAPSSTRKRLYRNSDDRLLAGVCSGIAAYFDVDPLIIRLLFLALSFVNGLGLVLYLILWLVIPIAETNAQKLEMRGKPLNVNEIQELVKEKSLDLKREGQQTWKRLTSERSMGYKIVNFPIQLLGAFFSGLRRLLNVLGPVVRIIFSIVILGFTCVGIAFATIGVTLFLTNSNSPYLTSDLPLHVLTKNPFYYVGLVSIYVFCLIPLLLFVLLGISLLRRKSQFRLPVVGTLIAIWILAAAGSVASGMNIGPQVHMLVQEQEERQLTTKAFDVKDFQALNMSGNYRLQVKKGEVFSIVFQGDAERIHALRGEIQNNAFTLHQGEAKKQFCLFCQDRRLTGTITLPTLANYQAAGNVNAALEGFTDDLILALRDNARVDLVPPKETFATSTALRASNLFATKAIGQLRATLEDNSRLTLRGVNADRLLLTQKENARVTLVGSSRLLNVELHDNARLEGQEWDANDIAISAHENSRGDISSLQRLNATSTGNSRITYRIPVSDLTMVERGNSIIRLSDEPTPSDRIPPENIRLEGTYTCLSRRDKIRISNQPCVHGLRTDQGLVYVIDIGLLSSMLPHLQPGDRLVAQGILLPPFSGAYQEEWQSYEHDGVFSVTSGIRVIEPSTTR